MAAGEVVFQLADGTAVTRLGHEDGPSVQSLMYRCTEFFELTFGLPTGHADAQSQFLAGLDLVAEDRKHLLGVSVGDDVIAFIDAIERYPEPDSAAIGLLLVDPAHRRLGLGARLVAGLCEYFAGRGIRTLRADCVMTSNSTAIAFSERLGFEVRDRDEIEVVPGLPRTRLWYSRSLE